MTSFLILLLSINASAAETCKATRETVDVPHSGQYHRMHPSGNYFLYTSGRGVTLVDITDRKKPKEIKTPMQNETYPVEGANGGWELMASPTAGGGGGPKGGMEFYRFSDMTNGAPNSAKPVYQDREFGEWYHSTAELPGSTSDTKKVRMLLFTDRMYKDYEMKTNSEGAVTSSKSIQEGKLCDNIFKRKAPTPEAQKAYDSLIAEIDTLRQQYNRAAIARNNSEARDLSKRIEEKREEAQGALLGPEYVEARKKASELEAKLQALQIQSRNLPELRSSEEKKRNLTNQYNTKISELERDSNIKKLRSDMDELASRYQRSSSQQRPALEMAYRAVGEELERKRSSLRNDSSLEAVRKALADEDKKISEFKRTNSIFQQIATVSREHESANMAVSVMRYGPRINQPILSKDGTYFAGLVGREIHVYKIGEDGNCELAGKTPFQGSKVSFSYPEKGKVPQITFTTEGGASGGYNRRVIVYDLEKNKEVYVSDDKDLNPYYPGFTKDGRVMFQTNKGVTIVDPTQAPGSNVVCNNTSSSKSTEGEGMGMGGRQ